jgi:Spy/CpxP family protein refolding chaperone
MIESKESKTRDIPVWFTGLVLLLCIGGGGWLITWYMRDTSHQVVDIPEDKTAPANFNGKGWRPFATGNGNNGGNNGGNQGGQKLPRFNANADGIQQSSRQSYQARVGETIMNINARANGFDFIPRYQNSQTPEQLELAGMRLAILTDATWRENLKITDEQLKKLRNAAAQTMQLDPADRRRLTDLWKAYLDGPAAGKAAAEKNFLAAVVEIGKKNGEPFKQQEAKRIEAIKAALTPEQIEIYNSSGGTKKPHEAKPPPAVAPAAVKDTAAPVNAKG